MFKRFIPIIAILIILVVVYKSVTGPTFETPVAHSTLTPLPLPGYDRDAAYVAAEATLAAGQQEMGELDQQATVASLIRNQAANAAAQATLDYDRRELMDLSVQATEISQNMAQAAATQQFIIEQNQIGLDATATAQSQAATATYYANVLFVAQAVQTAETNASLTAYSLTATPLAAIQADIARTRGQAERRAWWDEFVVTPSILFLFFLVALLLIAGGVMAYLRLMPVLELRLRTISRINRSPLLLVDGRVVDRDPPSRQLTLNPRQPGRAYLPLLGSGGPVQVEIVGPSEPSISNWITEAERKLRTDGWI